jgi:hypothetical protein
MRTTISIHLHALNSATHLSVLRFHHAPEKAHHVQLLRKSCVENSLLAAVSAGDRDHPPPHIFLRVFALFLFFASIPPPWSRLSLLSLLEKRRLAMLALKRGKL